MHPLKVKAALNTETLGLAFMENKSTMSLHYKNILRKKVSIIKDFLLFLNFKSKLWLLNFLFVLLQLF